MARKLLPNPRSKSTGIVILGLVGIMIAVTIVAGWSSVVPSSPPSDDFTLSWTNTGGIAGIHQTLTIQKNGSWILEFTVSGSVKKSSGTLNATEQNRLIEFFRKADLAPLNGTRFEARNGAADFFTYQIKMLLNGQVTTVMWVDSWASKAQLPTNLTLTQEFLNALVSQLSH